MTWHSGIRLAAHSIAARRLPARRVNLGPGGLDQSGMGFLVWLILTTLCGHAAYRSIRGGFERQQTGRLSGFGHLGCSVLLMLAVIVFRAWMA
jgi:hypothetical protein